MHATLNMVTLGSPLNNSIVIGVRAGGAGGSAAPPVSENFGQNAQNSGNEETINKRLN